MTHFTPEQVNRLLDSVPTPPSAGDVPEGFFARNAEDILRRTVDAPRVSRHVPRAVWFAAASLILFMVSALTIHYLPIMHTTDIDIDDLYTVIDLDDVDDNPELDDLDELQESDVFIQCF